ncbi:5986_t:CDS:2 [Ambispora gerdemannii]|uniref:tRNA-dihydrouridine(16/17) synthase [NAD(P)(+)] n=1 Tax=Ambispora gerdemannii TaxID=144530 RepID=A0A9N8ZQ26_9GLOM|nr:5986_t:CDS:2 [Ambispora gerdemannii]
MVDQSEQAWRVLSRRYGAQLCFTPMIHAKMFCDERNLRYRQEVWSTGEGDRPLIVQFCANEPEALLEAAKRVQDHCDAIDLNLGCPQHIARRGRYGAFLQDEWELIHKLNKTIEYARMIERAGAQMLTVHGRIRDQKGHNTGLADWEQIRCVKEAVNIPVIANGNILYFEDIQRCLEATGADGVMSAEGNLYNPALFANHNLPIWTMAQEYLDICQTITTKNAYIRGHLFKILRPALPFHADLRERLANANYLQEFCGLVDELKKRIVQIEQIDDSQLEHGTQLVSVPVDENGIKQYPYWICQPNVRSIVNFNPPVSNILSTREDTSNNDNDHSEDTIDFSNNFLG